MEQNEAEHHDLIDSVQLPLLHLMRWILDVPVTGTGQHLPSVQDTQILRREL